MNKLQKLDRLPAIPAVEQEKKEIWFPRWNCFCCHDTGLVASVLVSMVIDDYCWLDKQPVCTPRKGCNEGSIYAGSTNHDHRFTIQTCDELHKFQYDNWVQTVKAKQRFMEQERQRKAELAARLLEEELAAKLLEINDLG